MRYQPMPNMSKCQKSAQFLSRLRNRPTSLLDTVHRSQCGCQLIQTLLPKHTCRSTYCTHAPPDDTVCAAQERTEERHKAPKTARKLEMPHIRSQLSRMWHARKITVNRVLLAWGCLPQLESCCGWFSGLKNIRAISRTQVFHWNIHNQCHPLHLSVVLMLWPIGLEWLMCKTK